MRSTETLPNSQAAGHRPRYLLAVTIAAIGIVVLAGVWQTRRLTQCVTRHEQETLMAHAATVARSLSPAQFGKLTFTAGDTNLPCYHALHLQFAAAARHLGLTGLFTVAQRDGQFVFGPESYPTGHPYATVPGTRYMNPPAEVPLVFAEHLPRVTPLFSDEFGLFITAFVPVLDPRSGETAFLLAADMNLPVFRKRLLRVRLFSAALMTALIALLWTLHLTIRKRLPVTRAPRVYRHYAETVLCALILLLLTGAVAWHYRIAETHERAKLLLTAAQQQTSLIANEFEAIRKSLEGLAFVFRASDTITEKEFSFFTSHMVSDYLIQAVTWSPVVKPHEVTALELDARASGLTTYRVWHAGSAQTTELPADPSPCLYPIRFIEPLQGHERSLGLNQLSDPIRRDGLLRALENAAPIATRPLTLTAVSNTPTGILIYQFASSATQTGVVAFAYNVINALSIPLNRTAVSADNQGLIVDLCHLEASAPPIFLTSTGTAVPRASRSAEWHPLDGWQAVHLSFLAFGNTYGVVVKASSAWLAAHPLRHGVTAAAAGLLLTAVMTAFLFFLNGRRLMLEREVRSRTEELKLAHEKVTGILSAAPVAMMLVDRETRVLDANPRAERLVSNQILTCRTEPCGVFLTCANQALAVAGCGHARPCKSCTLRNTILDVAEQGEPVFDRDMTLTTTRQGLHETYHVKFGAAPVMLNGQRHVVIAIYDVTAWYRTEQLYRTLFNEMNYGFLLVEQPASAAASDFIIRAANPALQKLTGKKPSELIGHPLDRSLAIPAELIADMGRVLASGEAVRAQFFFEALNKYFDCTVFRPLDRQVAIIFTDVTDQKRAENALLYERNLLYALMDNHPDRIFFKDADLRFIKVSKEQARELGLASPAQAIGKTLEDLLPDDAASRTMEREHTILQTGKPLLAQVKKTVDASGKAHWDSVSKAPIQDAAGACIGLVGIARDITPEIELQQHLQHMTKMDAIGRLAGGVAHDFNNLLQAILGYTELLLFGMDERSPQHGDLKEIERAARRAADLTRQLLTFSRKQRIEPQVLDVNQTILSTEKMLRRLMGDTILITLDLRPDLKTVLLDPSQMEQILLNLAVNAKDAMSNGGQLMFRTDMTVLDDAAAASHPEAQPGTFVRLTVSDTGSGIPDEMLPHVFEPFFTTKERGKGTGLGLSVIYGIVKQCGGWITVTSSKGAGTHFSLYLPANETTGESPVENTFLPADIPSTLPGIGKTILLVEDEPGVRNLAALVLQGAGYKVHVCTGADEAKAIFAREHARIDLLFSDVVLIGQNGIDLALDLRRQTPALPCLLCSGYADDTVRWDSIQKEGFHFLPKPYPVAKLLSAVIEALTDAAP